MLAVAVLNGSMGAKLKVTVALGVLLAITAFEAASNPYLPIVDRNVFGLREPPPPPPPPPPAPVAEDNSELMLTGVVDFRLGRWALVTRTERGKSPRQYTLSVGEREDNLEVLDIDAEAGTARLRHGTAEVVLGFEKAGASSADKIEALGRKYVMQAKPFVDAHTRSHELREQREAQRRELERAAAQAELMSRQISTHMDEPRLP